MVDHLFEIKKGQYSSYKKVLTSLSEQEFDLLISPHESFTTGRFVRGIQAKKKVGYSQFWNLFIFDHRIKRNWMLPEPLRQLELISFLDPQLKENIQLYAKQNPQGNMNSIPEWASMNCSQVVHSWGRYFHPKLSTKYICLFPGSVWATKQWTESGFRNLAEAIIKKGYQVVFMGGKPEIDLCRRISQGFESALVLTGETTLKESLQILGGAVGVVTNDSAGQHLAALVQLPSISIFGPTVLQYGFRPWNPNAKVVENLNIDCRPCGLHGHAQCPKGHHRCMTEISHQEVAQELFSLVRA